MTDPTTCQHETTVPVDVRDHDSGGTRTVARVCTSCLAQLEPGWGCPSCEWSSFGTRELCQRVPTIHRVLVRPCREHA